MTGTMTNPMSVDLRLWMNYRFSRLSNLTNIDNIFLFPVRRPTRTLSSFQLGLRLMVC